MHQAPSTKHEELDLLRFRPNQYSQWTLISAGTCEGVVLMTTKTESVATITTTAFAILTRELGPVNTARFINQCTVGSGDYTQERDAIIGNPTVAEIVAEIKKQRSGKGE